MLTEEIEPVPFLKQPVGAILESVAEPQVGEQVSFEPVMNDVIRGREDFYQTRRLVNRSARRKFAPLGLYRWS